MKKLTACIFCVLVLFIIVGCEEKISDDLVIIMDKKSFDNEFALWENQILKSYQFNYLFSYSSAVPVGPIKVTVNENNEPIIEKEPDVHFHEYFNNTIYGIYNYIFSTFNYIESVKNGTYNDSGNKIKKIELKITYDKQYHFPTEANLSTYYSEPVGGGVSYNLKINNFTSLE